METRKGSRSRPRVKPWGGPTKVNGAERGENRLNRFCYNVVNGYDFEAGVDLVDLLPVTPVEHDGFPLETWRFFDRLIAFKTHLKIKSRSLRTTPAAPGWQVVVSLPSKSVRKLILLQASSPLVWVLGGPRPTIGQFPSLLENFEKATVPYQGRFRDSCVTTKS